MRALHSIMVAAAIQIRVGLYGKLAWRWQ